MFPVAVLSGLSYIGYNHFLHEVWRPKFPQPDKPMAYLSGNALVGMLASYVVMPGFPFIGFIAGTFIGITFKVNKAECNTHSII